VFRCIRERPPYFTDKTSILNALDLVEEDIKRYEKVFSYKNSCIGVSQYLEYKLGSNLLFGTFDKTIKFYFGRYGFGYEELDISVAVSHLDAFRKILEL
jgi:hypothetical protein